MTSGFATDVDATSPHTSFRKNLSANCVSLTGAMNGLGCHTIANAALLAERTSVMRFDRGTKQSPTGSQWQFFVRNGTVLSSECAHTVKVFKAKSATPQLDLSQHGRELLLHNVFHLINAWLTNATRPIKHFESRMQTTRDLIRFAS